MTESEYIGLVNCRPFKRFGQGPDYYDCFGLVADYLLRVKGVDVSINSEEHKTLQRGYLSEKWRWEKSDNGNILMCSFKYNELAKTKLPTHCGILLECGNMVLHANKPAVSVNSLKSFIAHYGEFEKWQPI